MLSQPEPLPGGYQYETLQDVQGIHVRFDRNHVNARSSGDPLPAHRTADDSAELWNAVFQTAKDTEAGVMTAALKIVLQAPSASGNPNKKPAPIDWNKVATSLLRKALTEETLSLRRSDVLALRAEAKEPEVAARLSAKIPPAVMAAAVPHWGDFPHWKSLLAEKLSSAVSVLEKITKHYLHLFDLLGRTTDNFQSWALSFLCLPASRYSVALKEGEQFCQLAREMLQRVAGSGLDVSYYERRIEMMEGSFRKNLAIIESLRARYPKGSLVSIQEIPEQERQIDNPDNIWGDLSLTVMNLKLHE